MIFLDDHVKQNDNNLEIMKSSDSSSENAMN